MRGGADEALEDVEVLRRGVDELHADLVGAVPLRVLVDDAGVQVGEPQSHEDRELQADPDTERPLAKRRGNPNWGKPEPIGPITPTITEFEQVVREFKLTPDQYLRSTRLREWARRNKNSKYIPEPLLEAWGFEIESTL